MEHIQVKAMGKINLGLDVTGVRPDGYHEVRMVMQTVRLFDRIDIRMEEIPGIRVMSNLSFLPADQSNLAYRAAELMMRLYGIDRGVSISLDKHIPVAAGMAGGSTDAAAVLYGMDRLFHLGLSQEKRMQIGLQLGADVPYCVLRGTALAEGIGERLTPLPPLPDCWFVLAKPPVSISTKYVYENLKMEEVQHPDIDGMTAAIREGSLTGVAGRLGNVLESVSARRYPVIAQIRDFLKEHGAQGALMSGSGPTVFGIFIDEESARQAAQSLRGTAMSRQVYVVAPYHPRRRCGEGAV